MGELPVDDVAVPPTLACPLDETGLDQIGHDPLRRSDRDAHRIGDIAEAHVRVASDAQQHLGVIRDELPPAVGSLA